MKKKTPHIACFIVGYCVTAFIILTLKIIAEFLTFVFSGGLTAAGVAIYIIVSYLVGLVLYKV